MIYDFNVLENKIYAALESDMETGQKNVIKEFDWSNVNTPLVTATYYLGQL